MYESTQLTPQSLHTKAACRPFLKKKTLTDTVRNVTFTCAINAILDQPHYSTATDGNDDDDD